MPGRCCDRRKCIEQARLIIQERTDRLLDNMLQLLGWDAPAIAVRLRGMNEPFGDIVPVSPAFLDRIRRTKRVAGFIVNQSGEQAIAFDVLA